MNIYKRRKLKEQEIKNQKEIERRELIADLKKKAEISRRFINDKRHNEYKELLEQAVAYKRGLYENLGDSVKTNDELIRMSLVLSTEIKTIQWILSSPHRFIQAEEKIKESEENNGKF